MDLDVGVPSLRPIDVLVGSALEGTRHRQPTDRAGPERLFPESFMRRHTEFASFASFRSACPCDGEAVGDFQQLAADRRDAFVDETTEFDDWREMRRVAAVEDALDRAWG